ncbi:Arabinose 5-phosphate isomerase KdsD [Chryseobacterium oranimense G311]|nr:Arabinose 5-phosphate isomerase KdsD [Chryseobacterium oranimense G311]
MERTDLISIAKSTLEIEISELEKLKNRINEDFARAVEIIHSAKGKLIVVGIGKSAHVAIKLLPH